MRRMEEVRAWLSINGPATAGQVARVFYPKQCEVEVCGGGPDRGTTVALWLLGRMQRKGMVTKSVQRGSSLWFAKGGAA